MKDNNCVCCMQGELVAEFGYPVCAMNIGYSYIFKERSKPGRVILAYKDHVSETINTSDEERNAFFTDVAKVARTTHKIHKSDRVNYGAYGDTGCHLHMHIVPKYNGGDEWGGAFQMNPGKVYLTDDEYEAMVEQIHAAL